MLTWRKVLFIFLLLIIGGSSIFYLRLPARVDVTHPKQGQVIEAVYATGTIETTLSIRIATERAARLTALLADEGMAVKAGQVLARFDDAELQASLQEAQVRQQNAGKILLRLQNLHARGTVSTEQLDQARTEADATRAMTQRIMAQIKSLTLTSPVDGVIIRRDGEPGDYMPVNQAVFFLKQADSSLRLTADVDEEDIPKVNPAQRVLITADAFPGKVFEGLVKEITPQGDPVTRSYRVRITLPDEIPFFIGMTAESNILIAQRDNALLIPNSAITNNAVWLVKDGKTYPQRVKTGVKNAHTTEITEGLTGKDTVIIVPPEKLTAGQAVREVWSAWPDNSS